MKFERLRLVGFKSFVEASDFVIAPGLTGVVGPNGCGKSNLVEALRWVMGENSYKNMRASGMDDVIFSGSGSRPARNSAEVGLHIDNADRTAPAAFNDSDEIQVSRRITREQGSLYRINGKEARAKDVQLLFADASTGARSPSMVGQGRIGELIQAKPQARRQLLEEAAGISGLYSRRHEAELRLRAAESNLERLEDVTAQLSSQIESLKRQTRQATRYKSLSADIRAHDAILLHLRWVEAKNMEGEATSALNQLTSAVAERANQQMEAAKTQAVAGLKTPELRDAEVRAAATLQRLQIARRQLDDDAARMMRRRDELSRRLLQLAEDIRREEAMIEDNSAILERLDAEEAELSELLDFSGEDVAAARETMEDAAARLSENESVFAALTAERAEAAATRAQLERAIADLASRRERLERQVSEADSELDGISARISALPDPAEKREALEAAEMSEEEAQGGEETAEEHLAEARRNEALTRQPVEQAKAQLSEIETEARTISKMLSASAAAGDFTPLADLLSIEQGFETALGAVLGDDLETPLEAEAPAHWHGNGDGADDPPLPSGCRPISELVEAPDAVMRRLRQVGLVEEGEGEAMMASLSPGQELVTRAGAVFRWDGHVKGADAPSAAALRLSQKNRLATLEDERREAEVTLEDAEQRQQQAGEAVRDAETGLAAAREKVRMAGRLVADARAALGEAERASGELVRRRDVVAETRSQLAAQLEDVAVRAEEAETQLAEAPDFSALEQRLAAQGVEVARLRGELAEARARHDGLMRENDARKRRIVAIGQERASWQNRAKGAEAQIATLRAREDEARDELEGLEEAPEELEDRRRQLIRELETAEEARKSAADRLAEAEEAQREADRHAAKALADLAEAREKRGRAEERLVSARERREASEARIREVLEVAPHEAFRLTGLAPDADLPDPLAVERALERLKVERERLGAVNLRAEEEQAELSGKLEELVRERDDILDAIRKLRGAIQSLNREGRERLLAAFDEVNEQFQRLFVHLFGGGMAELQLIESDDPLEAGLEILARPPGKKPQTMTLLSGGEQALTAMALIFAVFLTNPAPICVLDEVDAPLDDHNVERYCNLLDEMAATTETRFVVITHNPITMARMDRLFGVTMAEQGVSQLVSVDLRTAERLVEEV
ncbi:chromosome segregation SMC family protein [Martelella sp. AD-3]|uniref:chromosome segregation SMC family protein n=1 Tax=Martelella sp. AD-3 TaxID=686597 RepID=UPI0004638B91|nr:chromosome segregation SMC family protein [Martelella sp. AD-3]AMM85434.1 chromosome segregation protein SMC [Martelella sp. AD-3]